MIPPVLQASETTPALENVQQQPPVPVPIHATWYCTDRCTLRCCHCFVPVVPAQTRPRELNTEEGKRLIDGLIDAEVFLLAFAGGEPMLRDDFFELSSYARLRGLTLQTSTNGLDLDDAQAARLQEVGYQCIQISLDGLSEDTNAWTRGKGNFERTLRSIRACRKRGLPVVLAFAIHQRNLHEAELLAGFSEREGIEVLKVQPVYLQFQYQGTSTFGNLSLEQLAQLDEILQAQFSASPVRLKNIMPRERLKKLATLRTSICCTAFASPTIFPDGGLSPCFSGRSIARGNLGRDEFIPVWNAAVEVVKSTGKCGCNSSNLDLLRPLRRASLATGVA